jgi:hypothetical protein
MTCSWLFLEKWIKAKAKLSGVYYFADLKLPKDYGINTEPSEHCHHLFRFLLAFIRPHLVMLSFFSFFLLKTIFFLNRF